MRGALVGVSILLPVFFTFWKRGALKGTFEAHLLVRASMLAQKEWARSEERFPELKAGGTDSAEVWEGEKVLWKSPGAGLGARPTTRKLSGVRLADGEGAQGVAVGKAGEVQAAYVSRRKPYDEELLGPFLFAVCVMTLPVVFLVCAYPGKSSNEEGLGR